MVKIDKDIVNAMSKIILSNETEQGFLLGATQNLNTLDKVKHVIAEDSGKYFFIPNIDYVEKEIKKWRSENVCFCGIVHSHFGGRNLSKEDIDFGKNILKAYKLPLFWMGIGIVVDGTVRYKFFAFEDQKDSYTQDVDVYIK